jgi:hypothetical protein
MLACAPGLAAVLLGACSTDGATARADARAAEADATLAGYRLTGETRSCIPLRSIDEIDPLDDTRWLITTRGGEAYLNEVSRGCNGAAGNFTYLEYRTSMSSLCDNEIIRVRDSGTDMVNGSCGLGRHQILEPISDGA